jgi:hypothetical protein
VRRALLLLALAGPIGCQGAPEPPAPAVVDDPALVLGDVQYLLGEAVAAHDVEDQATSERSWGEAVERWRVHLAPRIRARDPVVALRIEYTLGRLGDALKRPGSKAASVHKALDKALRDLQPWLEPSAQAPADPAVPPT